MQAEFMGYIERTDGAVGYLYLLMAHKSVRVALHPMSDPQQVDPQSVVEFYGMWDLKEDIRAHRSIPNLVLIDTLSATPFTEEDLDQIAKQVDLHTHRSSPCRFRWRRAA